MTKPMKEQILGTLETMYLVEMNKVELIRKIDTNIVECSVVRY